MELELIYNEETQEWEERQEPFITIECETEEDFEFIGTAVAFYKNHLEKQQEPQTNADRIRAMSDEELALVVRAIISTQDCPMDGMDCDDCFFKEVCWHESEWHGKEVEWLKQPADPPKGE